MRISFCDTSRAETELALKWLQTQTFPSDPSLDPHKGYWWLAQEEGVPAGFAAMLKVPSWENTMYMARCGVLKKYRGQGLQKKFLAKREEYAKKLGCERVITTTYDNPISANHLIDRGFKTYLPQSRWCAVDTIYWLKEL